MISRIPVRESIEHIRREYTERWPKYGKQDTVGLHEIKEEANVILKIQEKMIQNFMFNSKRNSLLILFINSS